MKNKIIYTLLIILLILIMCGCKTKKCVQSHKIKKQCMYLIRVGRTYFPQYYNCTINYCDKYEGE